MQGIYYIKDKQNRHYVGSSKDIENRWESHLKSLKRNQHHNLFLQRSFNKHGEEYFEFGILELVDDNNNLFDVEQQFIDSIGEYNMAPACGGDILSNHPNKNLIIEKMRATIKEKYRNDEINLPSRKGELNPRWNGGEYGPNWKDCPGCGKRIYHTKNTCGSCRARSGKDNPFYGRTHSGETKQKLSEKRKGVLPANTTPVIANGEWYESATAASKDLNCVTATILNRIKNPNFENYKYA